MPCQTLNRDKQPHNLGRYYVAYRKPQIKELLFSVLEGTHAICLSWQVKGKRKPWSFPTPACSDTASIGVSPSLLVPTCSHT
ncbi:hypothetical protein PISMIDRAFT_137208 [Pisolithus microcarpus 441]|uniref:Uncharacterized protein n=1 Tax=Pisolithus microcarpus 441 TaxID=765257 RepID=A0A0C9ZYZ2_9AGAM|nr:hypothetical protein PISMIDRAFT_137208 [Pisolithus microcarpus 441]